MADTQETITDIIREARDKYTVHNCNECNFRKSCDWNDWNFGSVECEAKRQSISLLLGIDDDYFNKLLTRLDAAHKREKAEWVNANAGLAKVGDVAKLREALKLCMDELCDRCRDLASARGNPLPCLNGCEPVRKAKAALAAPPRNCDVGTAEEQEG